MTHNDKLPHAHQLLEIVDSDPRAHMLLAALPSVIAAVIRAWNDPAFEKNFTLEERVAAAINAAAADILSQFLPPN